MIITTAPTCWACTTAPATTVFPEHEPGPWKPLFACQPCLTDYLATETAMTEYA
ncbi:hypothetical protein AB0I35_02380 [Nocardia sp. NPDC050378]|uniref:hypothetical protein n=1 Tax=Nocardia sp. NPDC050378 TaxID=3155400 RepID=UPI0033DFC449